MCVPVCRVCLNVCVSDLGFCSVLHSVTHDPNTTGWRTYFCSCFWLCQMTAMGPVNHNLSDDKQEGSLTLGQWAPQVKLKARKTIIMIEMSLYRLRQLSIKVCKIQLASPQLKQILQYLRTGTHKNSQPNLGLKV